MMRTAFLFTAVLILAAPMAAIGHGISCIVSRSPVAVAVACTYDGGTPVPRVTVEVYGPSGDSRPFQTGETDVRGGFAFVPDEHGTWRLSVDDGTGHRQQVSITLEAQDTHISSEMAEHDHDHASAGELQHTVAARDEMGTAGADASVSDAHMHVEDDTASIPLAYKVIFGLSLIWGAAGMFYGFKARQKGGR